MLVFSTKRSLAVLKQLLDKSESEGDLQRILVTITFDELSEELNEEIRKTKERIKSLAN